MRLLLLGIVGWGMVFLGVGICGGENWGQWRGPDFNGSTSEGNLPSEWSGTKNVVWATPLPGPGASTPVVWGDRVFLTASDLGAQKVVGMGIEVKSGRMVWTRVLGEDRRTPGKNWMSSPSPVTDGKSVWFLTGTGALAAYSMDGELLWQRDLGKEYGEFAVYWGYSSSPLLYGGKLYVLALQNSDAQKYKRNPGREGAMDSYLLAVEAATGKTVWKQVRDTDATEQSRESYMTPYPWVCEGKVQIVIGGGECFSGHDAESGGELWRWWFTPGDRQTLQHQVPTPVAEGDLLFVTRPEQRPLFAIRAKGKGRLGDEAVAWTFEANHSWIASPLLYRGRLYVQQEDERVMVCMEPKTGRIVWSHKLPSMAPFQASPTGADGKIYCISMSGDVVVLAGGDEYREVGHVKLEEKMCRSSIVAANGRLFVRAGGTLYCIGLKG